MTCQECQLALASEESAPLRDAIGDDSAASRTAWQAACREFATEWRGGVQGLRDEYAASHLAWCSACQEFAAELQENAAAVAPREHDERSIGSRLKEHSDRSLWSRLVKTRTP
jgi:hypothetical protein